MNITEESVLRVLAAADPEGLTFKELLVALNQRAKKKTQLRKALKKLVQKQLCRKEDDRYYRAGPVEQTATGTSRKRADGSASRGRKQSADERPQGIFLVRNGRTEVFSFQDETVFPVTTEEAAGLLHADRVRFERLVRGDADIVRITKLVERGVHRLRGRLDAGRKGAVLFIPEAACFSHPLRVQQPSASPKSAGKTVFLKITRYPTKRAPGSGSIENLFGADLQGKHLIEAILAQHGVRDRFPPKVLAESERIPSVVRRQRSEKREDLRHLPFVTIDGEDARDFDDAVYLQAAGSHYRLWVSIADVASYVKAGSALDKEAALRGTSTYLPQDVRPMLPEALSSGICSLKEGVNRRTLTVEIDLDAKGKTTGFRLYRSLIRVACRLTYPQVDRFFQTGKLRPRQAFPDLPDFLSLCRQLAAVLERKREARGALNFSLPETRFVFDRDHRVVDIIKTFQTGAEKVIEQFMLEANENVARFAEKRGLPIIWRNHPPPVSEKIMDLSTLFWHCGLKPPDRVGGRSFKRLMKAVENSAFAEILSYSLLRCMSLAVYETERQGHYGLAASHYCHFTSPIRRYPDLIVHRSLSAFLDGRRPPIVRERDASHASDREQASTGAERTVERLTKFMFMAGKIGSIMDLKISGYHWRGFFVESEHPYSDGFLPFDRVGDDHYQYDERRQVVVGRRRGQVVPLGAGLQAVLTRLDTKRMSPEFDWLGWDTKGTAP